MNCKIIDNLNLQRSFRDKKYDYIFIDINSLTIVPYLNSDKYQSTDRIIITPFIESFKLYLTYKKLFPYAKFIFAIDGGISPIITKLIPNYKKKRASRRYTSTSRSASKTGKLYDYNIFLFDELMGYFNEVCVSDVNRNEADFMIGYMLNEISKDNKCLVLSHDKDLMFSFGKNDNVDVIYKQTGMKTHKVTYYMVDSIECLCHIFDFQYLKNTKELLYYRALIGDISDEIGRPFGLKSKTIVNNMFEQAFMYNHEITYEYIIEYFTDKFSKMQPIVLERFIEDLRKNIAVMNIFNTDILQSNDKIKLNSYIDELKYNESQTIEINSIYEMFQKYGLYLTKEDLDKTFKYLKGIT